MSLVDSFITRNRNALIKLERFIVYKRLRAQYKKLLKTHDIEDKKVEGEDAYLQKWSALSNHVEPYSYRLFCHYCGHTPNIVPEDIGHSVIEAALNPEYYRPAYSDKNLFPLFVGKDNVPRIVMCRINGGILLDGNYQKADKDLSAYIGDARALILKPSQNGHSGIGIIKFVKQGDAFVSSDGKKVLTKDFLRSYSQNFCLQETVEQHAFMRSLCSTCVNTLRLCIYRSVIDNEPILTAGIIRIGKEGSVVDNINSGGLRVGIQLSTGELSLYGINQAGERHEVWNDVDFTKERLFVPNWDKVAEFAKEIGRKILHHRLLALDIAIKADGSPILIEYNIGYFSYAAFMYTNQEVFGKHTDEVIAYCKKMK